MAAKKGTKQLRKGKRVEKVKPLDIPIIKDEDKSNPK